MKNPRASRRKEIIKIRAKINEKETQETITKFKKIKSWLFEKIKKKKKKKTKVQPDSSRIKGRRIKSTKLEMKMEKSWQYSNTKDHKRLLSATICQ